MAVLTPQGRCLTQASVDQLSCRGTGEKPYRSIAERWGQAQPRKRHAVAVVIRILLLGTGLLLLTWAVMVFLARRLPPGAAKDLAMVLPACVTTARRLWRDPRVPLRARIALGFAALWVLSPVDLIPEFLPVVGPLDDVIVLAIALRYAARQVPRQVLAQAWPGEAPILDRILPARDHG